MTETKSADDAFLARQRLLVIAPHADDESISSAGLIWRVKRAGGAAFVQIVSVGDLDHFDNTGHTVKGSKRAEELADAMKHLAVDDFEILYEDAKLHLRLDTLPRRDLVDRIERSARLSMEKVKPTMVVIPFPSYNQDHEAVYWAGITASRPHLSAMKAFQQVVLVGDAPQLAWNIQRFQPNFYVDISDCLEKKLEAFRRHRSQQRPAPHLGGVEALELLSRMRGREISVEAAEAYQALRIVI